MPLGERFRCAAQGIWRPHQSIAAQLDEAICACRFEANQDWETMKIVRPDALRTAHPTAGDIKAALLVIPASLAFGTGEHATTAMSLRFLVTRRSWD
jgi:ribosomal protein L11 methylase PrmA